MKEELKKLLSRSPVPMDGVLAMLDASGSSSLVIAGDENAAVLTLLEGVGLGCPELALVQQPCMVEITTGEKTVILLHTPQGDVRCSSMSDLALRLSWPEHRGAKASITCPHDLYGRETMVFAVLDEDNYETQLSQAASGATGAVIVLDGFSAPSTAVYACSKWLAQVASLQQGTAVLVHGAGSALNTAPAMLLAMQMGVASLPVIEQDTTAMTAREALDRAAAAMAGRGGEEGLCRSAAQKAADMLEAERGRLMSCQAGEKPRRSLADCFEAEIPGARLQLEKLVTSAMANQIYGEMREFGIFLQKEIEELLVSSVKELDKPKPAMRAFAQGWLDDTLSGYCSELINALAQDTLLPEAQRIYDSIFEHAWIAQGGEQETALEEQEMLSMQSAMGELRQMGHSLLAGAITFVVTYFIPELIFAFKQVDRFSNFLASEMQVLITPPRVYAGTKAKQLREQLDTIIGSYQDILTDTMLPQLRDELLGWFDAQTQAAMESLRRSDAQAAGEYETSLERVQDSRARAQEIGRFLEELAPYLA